MEPRRALDLLAERAAEITEITAPPSEEGEETESDSDEEDVSQSPVMDNFYKVNQSASILAMTNFSMHEFDTLYEL